MVEKKRLEYLDVLRFIGMLFIYVGHFLNNAGWLYRFVFSFHVPLFFFLSGCTENFNRETSIFKNVLKKVKSILVPFYFFALTAIVFKTLIFGVGPRVILEDLILLAQGCVRNTYFASSLWFLTCLFVVNVMFQLIKKLKYPLLMVFASFIVFIIGASNKISIPEFYNIKNACYYLMYYCLGYVLFHFIDRILTSDNKWLRLAKYLSGVFSFCYTALLFFQKNIWLPLNKIPFVNQFYPVLTALSAIWFFFLVAYMLRDQKLLADMGRASLYFCGSEYMIKNSVYSLMVAFFGFSIGNGFVALVYSFLLLVLQHKFIVPIEANLINIINTRLERFFNMFKKKKANAQ